MANCLTVATYNCKGLGSGKKEYISELCATHDFVLLQEHWLHERDNYFERELSGIRPHTILGMDTLVVQ